MRPFGERTCDVGVLAPAGFGYFAADASFLFAAVASAVRLIRIRRNRAMWDAKVEAPFEPAASACHELLSRYRTNW